MIAKKYFISKLTWQLNSIKFCSKYMIYILKHDITLFQVHYLSQNLPYKSRNPYQGFKSSWKVYCNSENIWDIKSVTRYATSRNIDHFSLSHNTLSVPWKKSNSIHPKSPHSFFIFSILSSCKIFKKYRRCVLQIVSLL